jgi:hypothetical protein
VGLSSISFVSSSSKDLSLCRLWSFVSKIIGQEPLYVTLHSGGWASGKLGNYPIRLCSASECAVEDSALFLAPDTPCAVLRHERGRPAAAAALSQQFASEEHFPPVEVERTRLAGWPFRTRVVSLSTWGTRCWDFKKKISVGLSPMGREPAEIAPDALMDLIKASKVKRVILSTCTSSTLGLEKLKARPAVIRPRLSVALRAVVPRVRAGLRRTRGNSLRSGYSAAGPAKSEGQRVQQGRKRRGLSRRSLGEGGP